MGWPKRVSDPKLPADFHVYHFILDSHLFSALALLIFNETSLPASLNLTLLVFKCEQPETLV